MKIGYCTGITFEAEKLVVQSIRQIKLLGFDYVELPVSSIVNCTEGQFTILKNLLISENIPCYACNLLFPSTLETTGPNMDLKQIEQYVQLAFQRCHALGAHLLVFGSSTSRAIKSGESATKAWYDLKQVLILLNQYAMRYDLKIAIEPLNKQECNLITHTLEGYQLCQELQLSHIKLLVDYFHATQALESPEILFQVKNQLIHMHLAEPKTRTFPQRSSYQNYKMLAEILRDIQYKGHISIEAHVEDLNQAYQVNQKVIELFKSV